jgi:hypothetical protein
MLQRNIENKHFRMIKMKPIIGEVSYYDMTPEDLRRHMQEAETLRAHAIREMFVAMLRFPARAGARVMSGFKSILADPQVRT